MLYVVGANIDLESRIRWARPNKHIADLVGVVISNAYDNEEYGILLNLQARYFIPGYIPASVEAFLEST